MRAPILPPAMLGILGGGQLGRMFAVAAKTMGYRVTVLDPAHNAPAAAFADRHLCAAFDDAAALDELASTCAAVTTEFENVNAESMRYLAQHIPVAPSGDAVAIAQDRILEKQNLNAAGLSTAPYRVIESEADFANIPDTFFPAILKTARFGYDGKGQVTVLCAAELAAAFEQLNGVACVLEQRVSLAFEISVIVARSSTGALQSFPVGENRHTNGILDVSIVPAHLSESLANEARALAARVAEFLQYEGVLAVEFFVLESGELLVNEIAPRPHNSGHYTLDACVTDQFQQQVRALCALPLGDSSLISPAVMVNILGDCWRDGREPDWSMVLRESGAFLHLYGKDAPRKERKMGHFTVLAPELADAEQRAYDIRAQVLGR